MYNLLAATCGILSAIRVSFDRMIYAQKYQENKYYVLTTQHMSKTVYMKKK